MSAAFRRRVVGVWLILVPLVTVLAAACYTSRPITTEQLEQGDFKQKERLRIVYPAGEVILHDDWTLEYPWAQGRIDELTGTPPAVPVEDQPHLHRFNLEDAQSVEIYDFNPLKVGALAGGGAAIVVAILMALMLASLSCPAVYLDLPAGEMMIGAAYPAAMFAAPDRRDYLSLPPVDGPIRVTIANEHGESQYVDRVALAVVEHDPGSRVVAADRGLVLLGPAVLPQAASGSPEALGLLLQPDGEALQNTAFLRRAAADRGSRDIVELTFEAPSSDRVALVVRAEQTLWYQTVLRRMIDEDPALISANMRREEWRAVQRIDVAVEVLTPQGWMHAGTIPSAGIEGFRERALILPPLQQSATRVRLISAEGFWRIDSVNLAPVVAARPEVRWIAPTGADAGDRDALDAIASEDGLLHEMHDRGETLRLTFPPVTGGTAFLASTGSYRVHPTEEPVRSLLRRTAK